MVATLSSNDYLEPAERMALEYGGYDRQKFVAMPLVTLLGCADRLFPDDGERAAKAAPIAL